MSQTTTLTSGTDGHHYTTPYSYSWQCNLDGTYLGLGYVRQNINVICPCKASPLPCLSHSTLHSFFFLIYTLSLSQCSTFLGIYFWDGAWKVIRAAHSRFWVKYTENILYKYTYGFIRQYIANCNIIGQHNFIMSNNTCLMDCGELSIFLLVPSVYKDGVRKYGHKQKGPTK